MLSNTENIWHVKKQLTGLSHQHLHWSHMTYDDSVALPMSVYQQLYISLSGSCVSSKVTQLAYLIPNGHKLIAYNCDFIFSVIMWGDIFFKKKPSLIHSHHFSSLFP